MRAKPILSTKMISLRVSKVNHSRCGHGAIGVSLVTARTETEPELNRKKPGWPMDDAGRCG